MPESMNRQYRVPNGDTARVIALVFGILGLIWPSSIGFGVVAIWQSLRARSVGARYATALLVLGIVDTTVGLLMLGYYFGVAH